MIYKISLIRFLQAFLCIVFFSIKTSHAVILTLPSEANTPAEIRALEAQSHIQAIEFSAVCAVIVDNPAEPALDLQSGTLISRSGRHGFVLTAAAAIASKNIDHIFLSFSPYFGDRKSNIRVKQRYIHPLFMDGSVASPYNVAVLEFDLEDLSRPISPLPIDGAQGYEAGPFQEATIVGYGSFGTNRSNILDLQKVHSGKTKVQFQAGRSELGSFLSTLPLAGPSIHQFSNHSEIQLSSTLSISFPLSIQFHPEQSLPDAGDVGGPLIFKSKDGTKNKVVGVLRNVVGISSPLAVGYTAPLVQAQWIPVFQIREWLREVTSKI